MMPQPVALQPTSSKCLVLKTHSSCRVRVSLHGGLLALAPAGRGAIVLDGPVRMTGSHVVSDVTIPADTTVALGCPGHTVVVLTVVTGGVNPTAAVTLDPCASGKFLSITRSSASKCHGGFGHRVASHATATQAALAVRARL